MRRKNELDFEQIFKGKKVPIIVLDERWHELFPEYDKTATIKDLEVKLNELIKQQGKLANDLKDLKRLKNKLMNDIISNMNEGQSEKQKAKKMDQNQKFILEINEKTKVMENELIELPYQIKELNEKLIIESAKVCYKRLSTNNDKVEQISLWIQNIREQLKEKLLEKQDMEMKNTAIYNYMHDMMGPELIQQLDEALKDVIS